MSKARGFFYIIVRYFISIAFVALALGLRMLLIPWTGVGAPFLVFFLSVISSSILLGPGPGLLSGLLSMLVASYFFVYQAHYTIPQARSQGVLFLIEVSFVCFWAMHLDRTKKRAEADRFQARKALEDRRIFDVMFENTSDFVAILDANGRPKSINSAGRKMMGLQPKFSVESMALMDFYPSSDWAFVQNVVLKSVNEHGIWEGEARLRNIQTGSVIPVSVCHFLIRDRALERVLGTAIVIRDISRLKQLQIQREEWTSVIAHDLRQPISVILMNATLLRKFVERGADERGRVACSNVVTAATDLSRMVDDLLDTSRMEAHRLSLNRKWIDPVGAVQGAVERLSHLTGKFRVTVVVGDKLLPVYADAARIEQVLGNLISNASKYGQPGSEIRIELRQMEKRIMISVTNHGHGIPANELKAVFSRFARSSTSRHSNIPGLGLGLYISKGLVEAHGGNIWVSSVPDEVTTFYFTLPTEVAPVEKAA